MKRSRSVSPSDGAASGVADAIAKADAASAHQTRELSCGMRAMRYEPERAPAVPRGWTLGKGDKFLRGTDAFGVL